MATPTTSIAKTVIATGASSGLGFELVKQLLLAQQPPQQPQQQQQPPERWRFILGARDVSRTRAAYDALRYDTGKHSVAVLPLELADLRATREFARLALAEVQKGQEGGQGAGLGVGARVDYLLLNAAVTDPAGDGGVSSAGGEGEEVVREGKKWCEAVVVNHFAQHYLMHLLRDKLVESKTRIVVVSSGAIRQVEITATLENDLKQGAGPGATNTYSQTKFVQLLGAHWWRRQLKDKATVVAVSPGLIPGTGLGRGAGMTIPLTLPDAKTVPEGAQSILSAFTRNDLPEDPEQIFLTSWGEWWNKDVYALSLNKELQDKWCPSKEKMEETIGLFG